MINPIEHSRTKEGILKYRTEPYVVVGDVYSHPDLVGRGGWSWYTGSASWYFVAGFRYLLGIKKEGNYLVFEPKLDRKFSCFSVEYQIDSTKYDISIKEDKNDHQKAKIPKVYLDEQLQESNRIEICLDGKKHQIEIFD